MRRRLVALLALAASSALVLPAIGQQPQSQQNQELWIAINKPTARKVAVAVPDLATPGTATLKSDLEYSGAFTVADPAHYPAGFRDPSTPEMADQWRAGGAEVLVDT